MNLLKVILKQETPMIHFESNLPNATIRGTELKPKIDNFIVSELKMIEPDLYENFKEVINEKDFGNGKKAPYKINISGSTETIYIQPGTPYFGNMGGNDMKAVVGKSDITLNLFSFNRKVLELIKEVIPYVFAYNNFGTRQNKGFGCFTPVFNTFNGIHSEYEYNLEEILMKKSPVFVKKFKSRTNRPFNSLKVIDENYKILKSGKGGKNFSGYKKSELMSYLYDKNIRWEKVKIKSEIYKNDRNLFNKLKVTNPSENKKSLDVDFEKARFTRALLGLAEFNEYSLNHGKPCKVNIKDLQGEIERFPSPLVFKVRGNQIYVFSNEIDDRMFNRKFNFEVNRKVSFELMTPTKNEFNLQDFLKVGLLNLEFKEVN